MYRAMLLASIAAAAACDVVLPTQITGTLETGPGPGRVVDAAVPVLTDEGYTVLSADRKSGFVTTDWREESSFAGQNLLGLSSRTRISVVYDRATPRVGVQMTRQKREGEAPWRTDDLSTGDRERMGRILRRIEARLRLPVTTDRVAAGN